MASFQPIMNIGEVTSIYENGVEILVCRDHKKERCETTLFFGFYHHEQ